MRRATGAVNPLSVLIIAAVVGGLYWLIMFGPKYLDNLDVKEAVDIAIATAKDRGDDALVVTIISSMAKVGWHREEDPESGDLVEKPGLGLAPENIVVERNEDAKTIRITVSYTRDVHLVPFNKWTQARFTVEKGGSFGQ